MVPAVSVTVGAAASFLLTTVLMDQMADPALVGIAALTAGLVSALMDGTGPARRLLATDRRTVSLAAIGGAAAFWAAPLVALSQRSTDAPPGSETLFFTTSAWAFLLVCAAALPLRGVPSVMSVAGGVTALAGSATLLANWERPSSFSPFVRFFAEEMVMLAAGALFAFGLVAIARASRAAGPRAIAPVALGTAALLGVVGVLVDPPAYTAVSRLGTPLILLGLMYAFVGRGSMALLDRSGARCAAPSLFLAPVAVTALAAVERLTGVYGANPIAWTAGAAGITAVISGVVVIAVATPPIAAREDADEDGGATAPAITPAIPVRNRIPLVISGIALVASSVSLLLPALAATSRGVGPDGGAFRADWTVLGVESAVGWLTVGAALIAVASAYASRRLLRLHAIVGAIAAIITVGTAVTARGTSFYTVTRWIPAEIQQAYGTEYARMSVEPLLEPVRIAALGLVVLACILILSSKRTPSVPADVTEEVA